MRCRVVIWAFAALVIISVTASAQMTTSLQAPKESLRVHVDLVNVPVTVLDRQGQLVAGLSRDDFTLTEDGHPETIRLFQANAARPLSIVLAIDTSISVRKDLPLAKQAAYEFAHSLLGREDRVELLGFAGEVSEVVPFTSSLGALDHGLRSLHGDGPTALYAAIARAANDLQQYSGRKVIVVISDGSNSVTGVDYQQARIAALHAQASIESIILVPIGANAGRDLGGGACVDSTFSRYGRTIFLCRYLKSVAGCDDAALAGASFRVFTGLLSRTDCGAGLRVRRFQKDSTADDEPGFASRVPSRVPHGLLR